VDQSRLLFQGDRFDVVDVRRVAPDGTMCNRQAIQHPGAVTLLPLLGDGRICLLQNYRATVDLTLIELPAGTIEPGEAPAQTAVRELAEETGYRAGRIELLTTFYMSPGILDEKMYLYLATHLESGPVALQPDEHIVPVLTTWDEALAMVQDGRIQDAKTLTGLLYFDRFGEPRGDRS